MKTPAYLIISVHELRKLLANAEAEMFDKDKQPSHCISLAFTVDSTPAFIVNGSHQLNLNERDAIHYLN